MRCRGVTKIFSLGSAKVAALQGVDLDIEAGEFVSIMGPSGSGKSTLLNILGCLDRPTAGTYELDGRDVSRLHDNLLADLRNTFIGFVFQAFHLLPRLTALENVMLPLVYRGENAAVRRKKAEAALAEVGLAERMQHRPRQMSGGEQQRVAIARALVGEPAIILADEPTGNLDSRTSESIMALFNRLHRERGITLVQVTHNPEFGRQAQRIIFMRDGQIEREERLV